MLLCESVALKWCLKANKALGFTLCCYIYIDTPFLSFILFSIYSVLRVVYFNVYIPTYILFDNSTYVFRLKNSPTNVDYFLWLGDKEARPRGLIYIIIYLCHDINRKFFPVMLLAN